MDEQTIFGDALEKTDRLKRAAYLDWACIGDHALRQRIESLLALHDEAGDFLESPPIDLARSDSMTEVCLDFLGPIEQPDCLGTLGQYQVSEIIGRGAMGLVLRAHDTKLNRTVAVKVLAPELAASPTARK